MRMFVQRKQYIGQVELLGVLAAYTTFGNEVAGRRVLHFVDNSSALAASCSGMAGPCDSRYIVQALHATLMGLNARVWFEYVRSKANCSDDPSRKIALALKRMWIGGALPSEPCMLALPEGDAWLAGSGDWLRAACGVCVHDL